MSAQKYTTTGTIHRILDKEERGQYTLQKVVLGVEGYRNEEFPIFEFFGKNAEQLSQFNEGNYVTIQWELKGREHNGKWFNNLSGWKIEKAYGEREQRDEPRRSAPDRNFSRPPERRSDRERWNKPGTGAEGYDRDINF